MSPPRVHPDLKIVRDGFDQSIPPRHPADIPAVDADFEFWLRYARLCGPAVDQNLFSADEWALFRKACAQVSQEKAGAQPPSGAQAKAASNPLAAWPSANIGKPLQPLQTLQGGQPDDPGPARDGEPLRCDYCTTRRRAVRAAYWRGLFIGYGLSAATAAFFVLLLRGLSLASGAL